MSDNKKGEKRKGKEIYEIFEKENRKSKHGDRIGEIRKKELLIQEKLSEILDVTSQTISSIERGEATLSPDKALIINYRYGYSMDWIYGVSEKTKRNNHNVTPGARIFEIRLSKDLTQQKLAEILHVTNQTISDIESGNAILSADKALILNREYGYSLDWIYGINCNNTEENPAYFVDIRNVLKIKSKSIRKIKISAEEKKFSSSTREIKELVITLGNHLYKYLEKLGDIEKRKEKGGLSDKECYVLIDVLNSNTRHIKDDCCYQAEIPLDDMEKKEIKKEMPLIVT